MQLGAASKNMAFGIYQRNGKFLTFPVTSRGRKTLVPQIEKHTKAGSLYDTDDLYAYTFLNIRGYHAVIRKEKRRAKGMDQISGIEKASGHMRNTGCIIIVVGLNRTFTCT